MIALTDAQLKVMMAAASQVPIEITLLQRIAAALQRRARRFDDGDLANGVDRIDSATGSLIALQDRAAGLPVRRKCLWVQHAPLLRLANLTC
jgi:hypothetical protein